ncbi:asparagine synthase (glutamine-hydrolyzing) [Pannonibacter sp. Q-1]
MCGIAGLMNLTAGGDASRAAAQSMIGCLHHRGPDDNGVWADDGIALAQARLSIIDLSAAGHQPMFSACGRFVIVFNGEIYNHQDLRESLDRAGTAPQWRGHSDTETLLAALAAWGVRAALERSTGMFAFALWDRQARTLTLGRDRLGEKPLYYGWQGGSFLFGSELKALRAHQDFQAPVDRNALTQFMRLGYVPAPHTIYQGIFKLMPGTFAVLAQAAAPGTPPQAETYWSAQAAAAQPQDSGMSDEEAIATLDRLLSQAVARQMVADVPLGAFLSGGIDSTTITALMQAHSTRPVKTFTIGFHEAGYDEAVHAKAVAQHLGCDHTELYVNAREAMDVIPRLPQIYDEPFADVSQIPVFLVSALARRHVTVSLSGDAGDELFGGYNRYTWGASLWRRLGGMPAGLRSAGGAALQGVPPHGWDRLFSLASPLLPRALRQSAPGAKIHKLAGLAGARNPEDLYRRLISRWQEPQALVRGGTEPALTSAGGLQAGGGSLPEQMMLLDQTGYLPDDILAKVDRAAMANSLETRVPLLDHGVVEFAWRQPLDRKIRNGEGKWLLRRVLNRHVPPALVERPKMGFAVPVDNWLRGPLRDWAEALLKEDRLESEGYLDAGLVRRTWREHLSGRRDWSHQLWIVLMFQAWLESVSL